MNKYLYVDEDNIPVVISAKRRPSQASIPRSGTWVIAELFADDSDQKMRWVNCGEILWITIYRKLRYVGKIPAINEKEAAQ